MEGFAETWAHAVADGCLRLSAPLPASSAAPCPLTVTIGDDRFPAQRLVPLDPTNAVVEWLPSPALLICIARHARERHAGRPVLKPGGVTRQADRYEAALGAHLAGVPSSAPQFAADVSRGGLFVTCAPQPPVGQELPLRLSLPEGQSLEVPVRVAHRVDSGPAPGVGVQFIDPTDESLRPLDALLREYAVRRPRVLVVDDEAIWRSTLARVLQAMNVDVVLARDGREGLAKLTELLFELDLVVLDLHMPHLDGRGLLERVRRNGNETGLRLFLFSAASPEELAALEDSQLADAVFSKLDPIDALTDRLAQELGRPPPSRP